MTSSEARKEEKQRTRSRHSNGQISRDILENSRKKSPLLASTFCLVSLFLAGTLLRSEASSIKIIRPKQTRTDGVSHTGGAEVRLCPKSHPWEGGKRETTDCSAPTVDSAAGAPLLAWAGQLCGAIPACRCTCNRTPPRGVSLTGGAKVRLCPKSHPWGGKRETAGLPQPASARATAPLPKEIF